MKVLTLRDILAVKPDEYTLITIDTFNTKSLMKWLGNRAVRTNILRCRVTTTDSIFPSNRVSIEFKAPLLDEYITYIRDVVIPMYTLYLSSTKIKKSEKEAASIVITYLLSIISGHFTFPTESVGHIINLIYPHLRMEKVPTEGNCYFCSIAMSVGMDDTEIRSLIANALRESDLRGYLAKAYVDSCGSGPYYKEYYDNPGEFIENFPDYVEEPCNEGDSDCKDCMWGSNDFDPFIANFFKTPIISINLDRKGTEKSYDIRDEFTDDIVNVLSEYVGKKVYYRVNQEYTLSFQYTFPEGTNVDTPNDIDKVLDTHYPTIIGYVFRHSHFNAILVTK